MIQLTPTVMMFICAGCFIAGAAVTVTLFIIIFRPDYDKEKK